MERKIHVAGYSASIDDPESFVEHLKMEKSKLGAVVEAYDAGAILGAEHLVVAWERARRAFSNGLAASDSEAMEARVYASCERQIKAAIAKTGVKRGRAGVALVSEDIEALENVARALGLSRDDSVLAPTGEKLALWGMDGFECALAGRPADLIFERMSLLEVER
jgi:tRNA threonylcarbamoyladenosine modification (KEOPS) complex Cgi121 subunit